MRRHQALSFDEAADQSPTLAGLIARVHETQHFLRVVRDLVPPPMHGGLQAGPFDGQTWCLLAANNAVAAKLRQMLPLIQARLQREGHGVAQVRIKVLTGR